MDKNGDMIQLGQPGPNGGILVLVADYVNKTISLIEIVPNNQPPQKIIVWEIQAYTAVGR
jgi:hypothetical protein